MFDEDDAVLCESGMHFCENPLNVLNYYPYYNSDTKSFSEYAEVEAPEDVIESNGEKSVTKQLKIGNKISFDELIKAGVEFNLSKAKFDKEKSIATGNFSGAMVVGRYSQAMCKNNSVAIAVGRDSTAKGDIGCYIVLTEVEWNDETDRYEIIDCKCFKVDGEIIKADTFYALIDGKPVEVE